MSADETAGKGDRTRARIRNAALSSFRAHGYEATTVRRIADELGLSVGATHYHFPSKNHLIQELYRDVQEGHRDAAVPLLAAEPRLIERLRIVFSTGVDQLGPYHAHAGEFLSAAVSPRSPINPLSEESAASFAIVEDLFREAVDGAVGARLSDDIRRLLPRALVLVHLLLAVYWVYDSSDGQRRTRRLLDRGLSLLGSALPLTRLPLLRAPLAEALALIGDVRR